MHTYHLHELDKTSIHGLSDKIDIIKYFWIDARGKPRTCKIWFKYIVHIVSLNKNTMVYI